MFGNPIQLHTASRTEAGAQLLRDLRRARADVEKAAERVKEILHA